jgi:hypothetical protein
MKKKKSERIKEEKRKKLGCFIFVAVEFLLLVFMLCRREYEDYRLENYGIPLKAVVLKVENFHFGRSANCPGFGYQYRYNGNILYDGYPDDMFSKGTKVGDTIDIIVDPDNPSYSIPVK